MTRRGILLLVVIPIYIAMLVVLWIWTRSIATMLLQAGVLLSCTLYHRFIRGIATEQAYAHLRPM